MHIHVCLRPMWLLVCSPCLCWRKILFSFCDLKAHKSRRKTNLVGFSCYFCLFVSLVISVCLIVSLFIHVYLFLFYFCFLFCLFVYLYSCLFASLLFLFVCFPANLPVEFKSSRSTLWCKWNTETYTGKYIF